MSFCVCRVVVVIAKCLGGLFCGHKCITHNRKKALMCCVHQYDANKNVLEGVLSDGLLSRVIRLW